MQNKKIIHLLFYHKSVRTEFLGPMGFHQPGPGLVQSWKQEPSFRPQLPPFERARMSIESRQEIELSKAPLCGRDPQPR